MGARRPTSFPNGVGNTRSKLFLELPQPDPFKLVGFADDFYDFNTSRWTASETGAAGTIAKADGHGGLLLFTNDAADDNREVITSSESFLLSTSKNAWFKTRLKVSHATDAEFFAGLCVGTDTDPFTGGLPAPGMGFHIADGAAALQFHMKDTGTAYAKTSGLATIVADTFVELGWYFDARTGTCSLFVDDAQVFVLPSIAEYPNSEEVAVVLGVKNGSAAVRTMTVDYVAAFQER